MNISVVCPFYNEEAIIERAIEGMALALKTLAHDWELILVNDGSLDNGFSLAIDAAKRYPGVRVIGYEANRGRGYALRHGIAAAKGDFVLTTEIDLSWGYDIVHRLVMAFEERPDADMIIASPHLPGGGYRNVPTKRVLLSKLGNVVLRASQQSDLTMFTGMTRGYRREAFLYLPLDEDEKEFHLEVVQKARAYGFKIYEIPCVLEWKDHRLAKPGSKKRKSSSKITKLVRTHLAFAAAAAPYRYIVPTSILIVSISFVFIVLAVINLFNETPSAFLLNAGLAIFLIALIVFSVGILSYQGMLIQRDIWRLRSGLQEHDRMHGRNGSREQVDD